jgi:hypothetical protein
MQKAFAAIVPEDADLAGVAQHIVEVVELPSLYDHCAYIMIRHKTVRMSGLLS